LPGGLSIDTATGQISGTINFTSAGASPYPVSVTVSDDGGATVGATDTFSWTVTASTSIALRSSAFGANAVANDLVLPKPTGVQAGDVMVAVVGVKVAPTVTPPGGWTLASSKVNPTNLTQLIYTKVASASEPATFRWTFNQKRRASGGILAFSGVSTAAPVDVTSAGIGSTAAITAPSAKSSVNGTMIVGVFSIDNASAITPPVGMTELGEIASGTKIKTEVADVAQPGAGPSGAKTAVAATADANVGQLIVLRPT
jgi:hypothetical protein